MSDCIVFSDGFVYPLKPYENRAAAMTACFDGLYDNGRKVRSADGALFMISEQTYTQAKVDAAACFWPNDVSFRGIPIQIV